MIIADAEYTLTISGVGDVLEPDDGIAAVGSGSGCALAAARAMMRFAPEMTAVQIATEALKITAEIDIYTNDQIVVEEL